MTSNRARAILVALCLCAGGLSAETGSPALLQTQRFDAVEYAGEAHVLPITLSPDQIYRARILSESDPFDVTVDVMDAALNPLMPSHVVRTDGSWMMFGGSSKPASFLRLKTSTPRTSRLTVVVEPLASTRADAIAIDLTDPTVSRFNALICAAGETRFLRIQARAGVPVGLWFMAPDDELKLKLSALPEDESLAPDELGAVRPSQQPRVFFLPKVDGVHKVMVRCEQGHGELVFVQFDLSVAPLDGSLVPSDVWQEVVLAPRQVAQWVFLADEEKHLRFETLAGGSGGRVRFGVLDERTGSRVVGGVVGSDVDFVSKPVTVAKDGRYRLRLVGQKEAMVLRFRLRPERADDQLADEMQANKSDETPVPRP